MACTTCSVQYAYQRFVAPNGGQITVTEVVVPAGKAYQIIVEEAVDKDTRADVIGFAAGTLLYQTYPDGFTPVPLTEGMTHLEIPPHPAGTYSLVAGEHSVFYRISADDGALRPRGVMEMEAGQRYAIPRHAVAVLITGAVAANGESDGAPTIFVARNADITLQCAAAGRMIYVEQAVA